MLIMRRRAGEALLIGGEVEIQIVEVGPGRVKLAITAPSHISVVRKEVKLTRDENLGAASSAPSNPLPLAALLRRFRPCGTATVSGRCQEIDTAPIDNIRQEL